MNQSRPSAIWTFSLARKGGAGEVNGRRYGESRERRAGHGASPILRQPDGRHEAFTFRASAIQNWYTALILHLGAKPEPPLSPQDYHPIRIPLTVNRLASVCDA